MAIVDVDAITAYGQTHSPIGWFDCRRSPGTESVFIKWTGELSQWLWPWWHHHKRCQWY